MGLRGPPPKPTKLKALEGNPGKQKLNRREPQGLGQPSCPDYLTGAARDEFHRALAAMPPGFFTAADVPVLTIHALAWTTYRNALGVLGREGVMKTGAGGEVVAHPAAAVVARQAEIIIRASDRLGMSPASRSRLQTPDDRAPSKFDGLLGARPALRVVAPEPPDTVA